MIVAGGGTGGHLFPGVAVAREVLRRSPNARVSFAGTARGLEARVIPREGFALDLIRSAGIKGKSLSARLRGAWLVIPGLLDAWRILSRRRPHVVVGVGGYSAGPVVLLAALRGIPTLVLEQNAMPGLTNRLLARWVRGAAVTYEQSLPFFRGRGFVSGNPVRPQFFEPASPSKPGRVLVLGGSQGAHAITWPWWRRRRSWCGRIPDCSSSIRPASGTWPPSLKATGRGTSRAGGALSSTMAGEMSAGRSGDQSGRGDDVAELAVTGALRCSCRFRRLLTITSAKCPGDGRAGAAELDRPARPHRRSTGANRRCVAGRSPRLARMSEAMHASARPDAAKVIVIVAGAGVVISCRTRRIISSPSAVSA